MLATSLQLEPMGLLHHGGRLHAAAARYGIPLAQWLDLSTGINPNGWPVEGLPPSVWARLPEDGDGLEQVAQACYGASDILPVAGSQAAIQALPRLRACSRVGVLHPGYGEHAHAWRGSGHRVVPVAAESVDCELARLDVLVLIHPNNPTGVRFPTHRLLHWHSRLAARGGWLVVDEAFMDASPEHSLCAYSDRPGVIVLRSLGKFFGLAGARVGFVAAHTELLKGLNSLLGPWTVSAPARLIAVRALRDRDWQASARQHLAVESGKLTALLQRHGLAPDGGTDLFQWVCTPRARMLHRELARRGILTRLFTEPSSLRFGLPGSDAHRERLDGALAQAVQC